MNLIEALEMAIKDEAEAVQKYRDYAKNAPDPESRLLFEQLAKEENAHHTKLNERLKAIKLMMG